MVNCTNWPLTGFPSISMTCALKVEVLGGAGGTSALGRDRGVAVNTMLAAVVLTNSIVSVRLTDKLSREVATRLTMATTGLGP